MGASKRQPLDPKHKENDLSMPFVAEAELIFKLCWFVLFKGRNFRAKRPLIQVRSHLLDDFLLVQHNDEIGKTILNVINISQDWSNNNPTEKPEPRK